MRLVLTLLLTAAVATAQEQIVSGDLEVSAIGDAEGMRARIAELFPE